MFLLALGVSTQILIMNVCGRGNFMNFEEAKIKSIEKLKNLRRE